LKFQRQNSDKEYVTFGIACLNALTAAFENRIWAEKEINEKGIVFLNEIWQRELDLKQSMILFSTCAKNGIYSCFAKGSEKGYIRIKHCQLKMARRVIDLRMSMSN